MGTKTIKSCKMGDKKFAKAMCAKPIIGDRCPDHGWVNPTTGLAETRTERDTRKRRERRHAARDERARKIEEQAATHVQEPEPEPEPEPATDQESSDTTPLMLAALDFERACVARDAADVAVADAEAALERAQDAASSAHTAVRGFRASLASAIGAVDRLAHEAVK